MNTFKSKNYKTILSRHLLPPPYSNKHHPLHATYHAPTSEPMTRPNFFTYPPASFSLAQLDDTSSAANQRDELRWGPKKNCVAPNIGQGKPAGRSKRAKSGFLSYLLFPRQRAKMEQPLNDSFFFFFSFFSCTSCRAFLLLSAPPPPLLLDSFSRLLFLSRSRGPISVTEAWLDDFRRDEQLHFCFLFFFFFFLHFFPSIFPPSLDTPSVIHP